MTSSNNTLSIDIETFSSVSLRDCGVYKYCESNDFEILLFAFSLNGEEVKVVDLANGETIPSEILSFLEDDTCIKCAYNAQFERVCLSRYLGYPTGTYLKPNSWRCTRVIASYLGLPMSLEGVGAVLNLEQQKMKEGKQLLNYFAMPCRPTKTNHQRTRNYPYHDMEKWNTFKAYNKRDVEVEMAIKERLKNHPVPDFVWEEYFLDQEINDRGVQLDLDFVEKALELGAFSSKELVSAMQALSDLENPNSVAQLKTWLLKYGVETDDLGKKNVAAIMNATDNETVSKVMSLRLQLGKTSLKKYDKMKKAVCSDGRVRGMFSFYGANRTGRFSSKLVQLQNLPANNLIDLEEARELVKQGDIQAIKMLYEDIPDTLSQLIRTAFIAKKGMKFIVCDYSAIEARVIAWLANEEWRIDAFKRGADIYVSSASKMFDIPENEITKELRKKGKVAELALGYGGGQHALEAMGALEKGLKEEELIPLVKSWRKANQNIVNLWWKVDDIIMSVLRAGAINKYARKTYNNLTFTYSKSTLFITLPSGRNLAYPKPKIAENKFGGLSVTYEGIGEANKWMRLESYGPKFVENIVQGIARDLLCNAIKELKNYRIVMHIHDEVVVEVDKDTKIDEIKSLMIKAPAWAEGLCLNASGYETNFYMKD